jgi:hypothetical protein
MKEADYIAVSNLARLRALQSVAGWLLPQNDAQRNHHATILKAIRAWEEQLERVMDGKVRS